MKKTIVIMASLSLLAACNFDAGGIITDYTNEVRAMERNNQTIVVEGVCLSSCALKLRPVNSCVKQDVRVGLHGIRIVGAEDTPRARHTWELIYQANLPEYLRKLWWDEARNLKGLNFLWLDYNQLINLGAKPCV